MNKLFVTIYDDQTSEHFKFTLTNVPENGFQTDYYFVNDKLDEIITEYDWNPRMRKHTGHFQQLTAIPNSMFCRHSGTGAMLCSAFKSFCHWSNNIARGFYLIFDSNTNGDNYYEGGDSFIINLSTLDDGATDGFVKRVFHENNLELHCSHTEVYHFLFNILGGNEDTISLCDTFANGDIKYTQQKWVNNGNRSRYALPSSALEALPYSSNTIERYSMWLNIAGNTLRHSATWYCPGDDTPFSTDKSNLLVMKMGDGPIVLMPNDEASTVMFNDEEWCADDFEEVDNNWYIRQYMEDGSYQNIQWDNWRDQWFDTNLWDYWHGWIDGCDEGYFTNQDYCYSDDDDLYFMNGDVACAHGYYWSDYYETYTTREEPEDEDEDEEIGNNINSYSHRPTPKFVKSNKNQSYEPDVFDKGNGRGTRSVKYFGIELEVEPQRVNYNDCAGQSLNTLNADNNVAYCKSDSSVSGYEIVTHPIQYEAIKDIPFRQLCKELSIRGTTSYKGAKCGVHIHIPKDSLTVMQWWKVFMFFDMFRSEIHKLSQRASSQRHWCKIESATLYMSGASARKWSESGGQTVDFWKYNNFNTYTSDVPRYSAINTQGRVTNEFRIFRGTTKYESFMSYIEFVDCLTEFVKQYGLPLFISEFKERLSSTKSNKLWRLFCAYASIKQYKYLCSMLSRKHLI